MRPNTTVIWEQTHSLRYLVFGGLSVGNRYKLANITGKTPGMSSVTNDRSPYPYLY